MAAAARTAAMVVAPDGSEVKNRPLGIAEHPLVLYRSVLSEVWRREGGDLGHRRR